MSVPARERVALKLKFNIFTCMKAKVTCEVDLKWTKVRVIFSKGILYINFRKKNTVSSNDESVSEGSAPTRGPPTEVRMTQDLPRNGIQMVLYLPPSYEETLQTSAADGSAFRESTAVFGFNNCSRNGNTLAWTTGLPPPYEDVIRTS